MLLLGGSAWAGALAARAVGWWVLVAVLGGALGLAVLAGPLTRRRGPGVVRATAAVQLVLPAVGAVTALRLEQVAVSPIAGPTGAAATSCSSASTCAR